MAASDRSAGGGNGISADLVPGLDLFAAAWLEKFCEIGGSVNMGSYGKATFGWAEYSCRRSTTSHQRNSPRPTSGANMPFAVPIIADRAGL